MLAVIPFTEGGGGKRRPIVVIQADFFNVRLYDTIVAGVTSNVALAGPPNRLLIDPSSMDGASSGLSYPSVVRCDRLFTIAQSTIGRRLGRLAPTDLTRLDLCLKAALGLL